MKMKDISKAIGFIGVGAMGREMVINLFKKTKPGTLIYICDVNHEAVAELCTKYPEVIFACCNGKGVAEKSVRYLTDSIP